MAHSEAHYRAAAQGLGEGFLGSAFDRSSLPDSDVSKIHTIAAFREEAELMGLKGGSVAGVQERGMRLARNIQDAKSAESEKARRSADNVLFLNLLEQESARLGRNIAEMEATFEERYGDAWRETIANKVLDPDEIPERREGESMEDYRERLEDVLIEKMIDPATGEIRPKYASNPETAEYARWAKDQYDKAETDELIDVTRMIENDPNLSNDEKYQRTAEAVEESNLSEAQALFNDIETGAIAEEVAAARVETELDARIATNDAALGNAGF
jgi:hypothetical protein